MNNLQNKAFTQTQIQAVRDILEAQKHGESAAAHAIFDAKNRGLTREDIDEIARRITRPLL